MQLHSPERVAEYEDAGLWGVPVWPERVREHAAVRPDRTALVGCPSPPDRPHCEGRRTACRCAVSRCPDSLPEHQ